MQNRSHPVSDPLHANSNPPYTTLQTEAYPSNIITAPPDQLRMDGAILSEHESLFVQQTKNDWFQEFLGFQANTSFNITSNQDKHTVIMYALEESSFLMRFFLGKIHNWNMTLFRGTHENGMAIAKYHRPIRCLPSPLKCCCYQEIQHQDSKGASIGATTEDCYYCCIPKFNITDAAGKLEFIMSKPTCVGGLCVDCCAEGLCTCRVPFYIFEGGVEHVKGKQSGKMVKVWSGMAEELLSDSDNFEVVFPSSRPGHGSIEQTRARLLGSLFLVNQLYFEGTGSTHNSRTFSHSHDMSHDTTNIFRLMSGK